MRYFSLPDSPSVLLLPATSYMLIRDCYHGFMIQPDFSGPVLARFGMPSFGFGGRLTPLVRILLAVNAGIFLLGTVADQFFPFTYWFGLVPVEAARGAVWQLATYMFLHGGIWHLLLNCLALWIFGGEVESELGTRRFARLYAIAGVGAGLCAVGLGWGLQVPVVGASGAIFGILIAYAMLFPYRPVTLLLFFVLPLTLQARWLVALYGVIEFLTLMQAGRGSLGHVAHLGGLLFGYIYMKWPMWMERRAVRAGLRRREAERRAAGRLADQRARIQGEIDSLLEKISREGMDSLTEDERRRLREASERMKHL